MNQEASQQHERKKAVALKYAPGEAEAPTVVAKGSGTLADSILEKAMEHGVPIQEDAALVEVLSKLDLDTQIPPELYQLVAEVLTFVYQTEQKAKDYTNTSIPSREELL